MEILYFEWCPTYRATERTLREVLAKDGIDAGIELVTGDTDEEAQSRRFPGSPTIRVDNEDLFPLPERAAYALGCRMYSTTKGLGGADGRDA